MNKITVIINIDIKKLDMVVQKLYKKKIMVSRTK